MCVLTSSVDSAIFFFCFSNRHSFLLVLNTMFNFNFFCPLLYKSPATRKDKPLMKDFQTLHTQPYQLAPLASFFFSSICWKGELKYEDGRCSTSSENCNFCSPALLADRRYFISVVTDVLIKHQEQSAVPVSFSFPYKHTYTHIDSCAHRRCVHTKCAQHVLI